MSASCGFMEDRFDSQFWDAGLLNVWVRGSDEPFGVEGLIRLSGLGLRVGQDL